MALRIYRFRDFRLDPQARELYQGDALVPLPVSTLDCLIYLIRHRDRTVGRDELTAAVWGRVDISEVSLSHAIMRLRRLLGDTGNDQNSIRTLPRLGYRWIVEPTIEEAGAPAGIEAAPSSVAQAPAARSRAPLKIGLSLLALLLAGFAVWAYVRSARSPAAASAERLPAMVLPARVDAAGDWSWLRFGFMDLVANRLRKGELATTPSETVVSLVNAGRLDADADLSTIAPPGGTPMLMVRPAVALANGLWNVRLDARGDGRDLVAEAQAKDVLAAGRAATDDLLMKLGRVPPSDAEADPSLAAGDLAQRIHAAVLSGQLRVAETLIRNAPPSEQDSPDIALSRAALEFFEGDYESSRKHAEALLDRLPPDKYPDLRARVLNRLGATLIRQGEVDAADAAFVEAIRLLELENDSDALATAYTGRGVVAGHALRLDEAASHFGQARTLHEMSNDAFGVARVDLNLGAVAMDRGLPASAVPIFEDAAKRFESLSTPEALNSALRSLADAHSMLLDHDAALATTDRFWPIESHNRNPREGWWMMLSRAVALAGVGRLREAEALLEKTRSESDAADDAEARLEAGALAADIALLRNEPAKAADLAGAVLTPALENTNWQDYVGTWFTRVRGLQRSGRVAEAADEIRRLRAWADHAPSDRGKLYATLAEADQARAERRQNEAIQRYAEAMALAERLAIPEDIVIVGEPYVDALVAAGRIDPASAIAGRLAPWADKDMRAAHSQALVYQALGKTDAARRASERARSLAGERALPADLALSGP